MNAQGVSQSGPDEPLSGRTPAKAAGISRNAISFATPTDEFDASRGRNQAPGRLRQEELRRALLDESISKVSAPGAQAARRGRPSGLMPVRRGATYR